MTHQENPTFSHRPDRLFITAALNVPDSDKLSNSDNIHKAK